LSSLKTHTVDVCKGHISHYYIESVFKRFDNGYIYYDNNELFAFCLWKHNKAGKRQNGTPIHSDLDILLICGNHPSFKVTKYILNDIIKYCLYKNIEYITLMTESSKLSEYYKECGFDIYKINTSSNGKITDIYMKMKVVIPINKYKHRKTLKKKR
jgi:hypothetical protein